MSDVFTAAGFITLPQGHDPEVEYHSDTAVPETCHCNDVHAFCAHLGSPLFDAIRNAFGEEPADG